MIHVFCDMGIEITIGTFGQTKGPVNVEAEWLVYGYEFFLLR